MQIIEELERFSDQDDQIRALLNRRSRVKDLKIKAETSVKKNIISRTETVITKKTTNIISSPVKKSPLKTIKKTPEYGNTKY